MPAQAPSTTLTHLPSKQALLLYAGRVLQQCLEVGVAWRCCSRAGLLLLARCSLLHVLLGLVRLGHDGLQLHVSLQDRRRQGSSTHSVSAGRVWRPYMLLLLAHEALAATSAPDSLGTAAALPQH